MDKKHKYGFIQIYTIDIIYITKNGTELKNEWRVLITPDEDDLHADIIPFHKRSLSIADVRNIQIKDTFRIDFYNLSKIYRHANDHHLDIIIQDKIMTIIGDHQLVILTLELPVNYELSRIPITLKATRDFLIEYGFPIF
jgi:hypothetical protein